MTQAGQNALKFIRISQMYIYNITSYIYYVCICIYIYICTYIIYIIYQLFHLIRLYIYCVQKPSRKKLKRQSTLSLLPPPSKMLALAPPEQNPAPVTTQSSITGKFSKEHLKQESLNDFLNVIPLTGEISKKSY